MYQTFHWISIRSNFPLIHPTVYTWIINSTEYISMKLSTHPPIQLFILSGVYIVKSGSKNKHINLPPQPSPCLNHSSCALIAFWLFLAQFKATRPKCYWCTEVMVCTEELSEGWKPQGDQLMITLHGLVFSTWIRYVSTCWEWGASMF